MLNTLLVLGVICLYLGFLAAVAFWVERKSAQGKSPAEHPWVYSLSLAVYCTAWTYYGSVGKAATSGLLFLPIYLGPTAFIACWWIVLRKLVRLKNKYRITSIADFISARYGRSQPLAALASGIALVGILPYIALQLKAIISTFSLITAPLSDYTHGVHRVLPAVNNTIGPLIVALLAAFTIILGVRRLDPTERHEGMIFALMVECVVKLFAFLCAGVFVTYFLFDGFGDLFRQLAESPLRLCISSCGEGPSRHVTWASYFILSTSAILFLPRQFHVAVVENSNERHILTAMWLFPLYMLLINIFVLPIAVGGLLLGYPIEDADRFVLMLPLRHTQPWLALLVFIGGFSAAAGMIMISLVTMATMLTNHLLLPCFERVRGLSFLRRHLLRCRWGAVVCLLALGYGFERWIFQPYMLVNIGLISFAAVLQFAPAILGGIFWQKGNRQGAFAGLSAGFTIWCYTQLVPSFVKNGWLPDSLLTGGPWGLTFFHPEQLFGLTGLDPLSHTVFWSMLLNIGCYVGVSLYFHEDGKEDDLAAEFVGALEGPQLPRSARHREAYIDASLKKTELINLLGRYFAEEEARAIANKCLAQLGIGDKDRISIAQLVELHNEVEKFMTGSFGSATAHKAVEQGTVFTPRERKDLSEFYGEILADLRVSPTELKSKIDFYQEREKLLLSQARELEEKVHQLQLEIKERMRIQTALRESEERYRKLVETMDEGLMIEDENGCITYVNDKLCRLWGRPREAIIGCRSEDFIELSQAALLNEQLARARQGEVVSYEATWKGKDGQKVITLVSCVPMFDSKGCFQGSFSVITDISQLKAMEREKSNLISMFAHDMRSSLTGIHGLGLRLLTKADALDSEKQKEYLRIINKEASKLESLVDDFLEFSRLESGRFKLDLRAVSLERELLELFEIYQLRAAAKGLQVELKMDEPLPVIKADVNRLRRVLTNLLDNAIKFSREQGAITITVQEAETEIVLKVADQGCGIPADELPFIFDLFHRGAGRSEKEGYGIGLATVKAIVEGHHGRVHVVSEVGRGSVFSVHLPK